MKKLISVITALALLISLASVAFAVESNGVETAVSDAQAQDVSGQYYDALFGDGSAYQVIAVAPTEENDAFLVSYIAQTDTDLCLSAVSDLDGQVFWQTAVAVSAGEGTVKVDADIDTFPAFYQVNAMISGGQTFTCYDHSLVYQDFMATDKDAEAFANHVVLDYGMGYDGVENFAVVSEDVQVVYVDSMSDVTTSGDSNDQAALFTLLDEVDGTETYLFNGEDVGHLDSGDKLLILPRDDVNQAKAVFVDTVEQSADLFSADSAAAPVTVTVAEEGPTLEEVFDFVRIHVQVEADTDDLDTSTADSDIILEENEENQETAELLGSIGGSKSASKSFTLRKTISGINVRDTFTLKATVSLNINYSWLTLKGVTAAVTLSATNAFTISSSYSRSYSAEWHVGTIPVGTVAGVTFSIPVYITFSASFNASFNYTATQSATAKISATYSNGSVSCTTSKSASSGKSLKTSAGASASLGVKAGVQASLSIVRLSATITGEVGIQATVKYANKKLSGDLSLYLRPGFTLKWFDKKLVNKTWSKSTVRLASLALSKASYFSMSEISAMTAEEISAEIEQYKAEGLGVTLESTEDLQLLSDYVAAGKPTKGIDFVVNTSSAELDLSGRAWIPIGSSAHPFEGTFDGRGVALSNMTITTSGNYVGLFGLARSAVIHDVTLKDAAVSGGGTVGSVVGQAEEGSKLYDLCVSGAVQGTGAAVGGLVGTLDQSSLLNSCSQTVVSGNGEVGGLVGAMIYSESQGQLANCYFAGTLTSNDTVGGVCGTVELAAGADTVDETTEDGDVDMDGIEPYTDIGVAFCYYYLTTSAEIDSVGGQVPQTAAVLAWALTQDQAAGVVGTPIAQEGCAAAETLVAALNQWYALYGTYQNNESASAEVPEGSSSDYYNHWYQDVGEDDYPHFQSSAKSYPLTVIFVYEDGTPVEGKEPVTLYYKLGEQFDVDPYYLEGYHTNVDDTNGYQGYMNPDPTSQSYDWADGELESFTGLEFRIVYMADTSYAGEGANLSTATPAASGSVYKMTTAADFQALSAYVSAGGNTKDVTFDQTTDVALSEALTPIGTAEHPFEGTYQGNYMTVSGLVQPLFGATSGAEIKELKLSSAVTAVTGDVGALAGSVEGSRITACEAMVATDVTATLVGGLVGSAENSVIDLCTVSGSIRSSATVGGMVGSISGGTITNCAVTATAQGVGCGGISGAAENVTVTNSFATGAVTGTGVSGGLAGTMVGGAVKNCYTAGTVIGAEGSGAVFGSATNQTKVENLYYLNDSADVAVGSGELTNISSFSSDTTMDLCDALNAWVAAKTSAAYHSWAMPADSEDAPAAQLADSTLVLPGLGGEYSSWLMDVRLTDGVVTYCFDKALIGDGLIYLAIYADNGQMLGVCQLSDSGNGSVPVGGNAAYAKCFVLDDAFVPSGQATPLALSD